MQPTQALVSLRYVTRIAAVIILMAVAVGFFLPADYRIERTIMVPSQQQEALQERLYDPSLWSQWMHIEAGQLVSEAPSGSLKSGDRFVIVYDGETTKQGSIIIDVVSERSIVFTVQPNQKTQPIPNTLFITTNASGSTQLEWVIEGELDAGFLSPYLAFFANNIAGSNIEKSLANLKR